jgi:chemotaxis signal transduction protein
VELPSPGPDLVGVLPGDPPFSVLSTLGGGGDHVLVCVSDEVCYGLQVLEVLGVRCVEDHLIGPPPVGQGDGLVVGTISDVDDLVLVADARAIGARR